MYKLETHMHTSQTSACASMTGEEQARRYKSLGYDGIIITDHFFNGNCYQHIKDCGDWETKVNMFTAGYEAAKAEGDRIGLDVFFGLEYCYCGADLLTYGIDKQWLIDHPECIEADVFDYCDMIHQAGGAIVHAHPFRQAGYLREIRLVPDKIDGVEVYNGGNAHMVYNDRAKFYAESFGFTMTGGSDSHHIYDNKLSGVLLSGNPKSIGDYVFDILNDNISGVIYPEDLNY
ncbi:MAG: PHP domain-containing protein [Ruminococcus sp.]|nr:PHP domain-containing protein [Ruminococcus sp.]